MKTCYVNTGSTAGGDGTTNTTSGTHRAYASLNEFESSEQAVLAQPIEAICEGTTVDNTVVRFDGWTTSSGNYISIKTTQANRHDGKWNTNKYRMETSATDNYYIINFYEDYACIDGLQLDVKHTNTNTMSALYFQPKTASSTCEYQVSNSIIRMSAAHSANAALMIRGILINGDDAAGLTITTMYWNNIVYGFGGGHIAIGQIMMYCLNSTMTNYLYNNTCASGNKKAYLLYGGTCYAKNNIALDCVDNWYNNAGTWHADSIKNTSDMNDAPGSDAINDEPIFVDKWGSDYHLDSTDTVAKDSWANIYADSVLPITVDIDGDVRPNSAAGDIGADEYTTDGDIKSINAIVWASVKSINAVVQASVKSINGITAT